MDHTAHWRRVSADAADRQMREQGREAWDESDAALAAYLYAMLRYNATKAAHP